MPAYKYTSKVCGSGTYHYQRVAQVLFMKRTVAKKGEHIGTEWGRNQT